MTDHVHAAHMCGMTQNSVAAQRNCVAGIWTHLAIIRQIVHWQCYLYARLCSLPAHRFRTAYRTTKIAQSAAGGACHKVPQFRLFGTFSHECGRQEKHGILHCCAGIITTGHVQPHDRPASARRWLSPQCSLGITVKPEGPNRAVRPPQLQSRKCELKSDMISELSRMRKLLC